MWIYLLLVIVVFILIIISAISITKLTYKSVDKRIKNKRLKLLVSFIPLLLFVVGFFIDYVNAIVVDIHLMVIISIIKLIAIIIKNITKKDIGQYKILLIGVILTIIILTPAYFSAHHVVKTNYTVYTNKDIGVDKYRIVQISDSHLGSTFDGKKFIQYMKKINKLNPDLVVITGDFIDNNTSYKDMIDGTRGLGKLKTKNGVYFIYGNHDVDYYNMRNYDDNDLRKALKDNNVNILEDSIVELTDNIVLIGRKDASNNDRIKAYNLTKKLDKNKYIITLDHQPSDYKNEIKAKMDLVLSGHTHGGQLFPLGQFGVLLGANDKIYGMEKRKDTTFVVNSGISDWEIKFKTGTISEYVVIDIKKD